MTVAEAILKVSFSVGKIEKNGEASFGSKYKYQKWDDVLPEVRNACILHNLTIVPNVTQVVPGEKKVIVMINYVLICGDDRQEFGFAGESLNGDDKAIQKAITSATKYFFLKTFMIPCEGDIDPDGVEGATETKTRATTPATAKKQEVTKESNSQAERIARANMAFSGLGADDAEDPAEFKKQLKAKAQKETKAGDDWVDTLEQWAKETEA